MTSGQEISELILGALENLSEESALPLHEPYFSETELDYVTDCITSTWVSSNGRYVDLFERALEDFTGSKYAIAMVNGTAALQLALEVAGIERGTEIFTPALSFVATANAIVHAGCVPNFVDCDSKTLGISPEKLHDHISKNFFFNSRELISKSTGRKASCIVPMHTFGHPVDMNSLTEVAKEFKLTIVEDAAEALGSKYYGKSCGTLARLGALSFNGNKIITTGGGGAILTNDKTLAQRAKHLSTTAKVAHPFEFIHNEVGYNFRMPNINAALGLAQIQKLNVFLKKKRRIAQIYSKVFEAIDGLYFFEEPENCRSNYWLNTIILDDALSLERDEIIRSINDAGHQCRPAWRLLTKLDMYKSNPRASLETSETLERKIINLPSSASMRIKNQ